MIPRIDENTNKDELQDADLQYKDVEKDVKWYRYILINKPLRLSIVFLIVAVLTPALLYQFLYFSGVDLFTSDSFSLGSCLVPRISRYPCGYGNVSSEECHPQCCYDFSSNMCFHRFPSRFSFVMDRDWTENITLKPRVATVPYGLQNSVTSLRVSLNEISATHLSITYYDADIASFEGDRIEEKDYTYSINVPEFNIVVKSNEGHDIFDTVRGPLVASENIWELVFKLTDETMYGFGEIPIKTDTVKMIYNHKGGMSSIPLIFAKSNGSFHGLLIDVPEPTEITFMSNNGIVVRSINKFGLKFHIFTGPKPEDIMRDVMKLVQFETKLEYWMLGAHVCSDIPTTIADITTFIQQANSNNMPYDSHCVTPIAFDNSCENSQAELLNTGGNLYRNAGKKIVPHISPFIFFEEPEINHVTGTYENSTHIRSETTKCLRDFIDYSDFILKDPDSLALYKGSINNKHVIYPSYENVSDAFMEELWVYRTDFDGVILENSWPLDESDTLVYRTHKYLPYFSENFEHASNLTLLWNITNNGELHLHDHNKYGNHFADAINMIKEVPTWTSSQWMNGKTHVYSQNVPTSWTNLRKELVEAALGGISGQWIWSSPVCGDTNNFNNETHANLCLKWYMAATYMPTIRIHSSNSTRDPLSFPIFERNLMINALRQRMALTPYFFTTLQRGPLLRPMFYQFPDEEELHDLDTQFGVGDDLLMIPNLEPSQSMVHFVLPPGVWYEFWGGLRIETDEVKTVTMMTTDSDFLVLMRAGSIIILQKDIKLTAELTRTQSSFSIKIALDCNSSKNENATECFAEGELYLDEIRTVYFEANDLQLNIRTDGDFNKFCENTNWATRINEIDVYGLNETINNFDHHKNVLININLCDLQETGEIVVDFV